MHAPIPTRCEVEQDPSKFLSRSEFRTLSSLIAARRERNRRFANTAKLFSDPAWDILIDLLDAEMSGKPVSITGACGASGVPPTTALRYIRLLEQEGLIARESDDADGRRVFLSITIFGWTRIRAYAAWLAALSPEHDVDRIKRMRDVADMPAATTAAAVGRYQNLS